MIEYLLVFLKNLLKNNLARKAETSVEAPPGFKFDQIIILGVKLR